MKLVEIKTPSKGLQLLHERATAGDPDAQLVLEGIMQLLTSAGKKLVAKAKQHLKGAALSVAILMTALNPVAGQAEEYYQEVARATFQQSQQIVQMSPSEYETWQFELEIAAAAGNGLDGLIGKSQQEVAKFYKDTAKTILATKPEAPESYKQAKAGEQEWNKFEQELNKRKAPHAIHQTLMSMAGHTSPAEAMDLVYGEIKEKWKDVKKASARAGIRATSGMSAAGVGGMEKFAAQMAAMGDVRANSKDIKKAWGWMKKNWDAPGGLFGVGAKEGETGKWK